MPRIVTADDLRARLGRELDALRESEDALYVSKRGRLAGILLDPDRYAELIDRLDYLEDSLAALRRETNAAPPSLGLTSAPGGRERTPVRDPPPPSGGSCFLPTARTCTRPHPLGDRRSGGRSATGLDGLARGAYRR
jgi:PHD/YefM family antitoxin component YafN of YafNO toxin-antitoxin module